MAGTDMLNWARASTILLALGTLAGCAALPADTQQATLADCTQQADSTYQSANYNGLARTGQNGLYFAPMPNHVFDAQRMGTLDARNNQIKDCVDNGNPNAPAPGGAPLPAPQIITP